MTKFTLNLENKSYFKVEINLRFHELMSFFSIVHINVGVLVSKITGITQKYSNLTCFVADFFHWYFWVGYKVILTLVGYLNNSKHSGVYFFLWRGICQITHWVWQIPILRTEYSDASRHMG